MKTTDLVLISEKTNKPQTHQPPLESFRVYSREMFPYGQKPHPLGTVQQALYVLALPHSCPISSTPSSLYLLLKYLVLQPNQIIILETHLLFSSFHEIMTSIPKSVFSHFPSGEHPSPFK